MNVNETSFWSARIAVGAGNGSVPTSGEVGTSGFWNNPAGNPTPPDEGSEYSSPWRRHDGAAQHAKRQNNPSPAGILYYQEPIQYFVRKTGYYCVGMYATRLPKSIAYLTYWIIAIVPVTVLQNPNGNNAQTNSNTARQASTDVPYHPKYQGTVLFQNKFKGKLPAAEYPKVNVRGMVWPRFL